jgi:NAD(P)-dependent dehydrogenase (short-subunit alcohol dehydrogenase family)
VSHYNVNGKVALVTGAARGIGFATAEALARRGAAVALVDLDPAQTEAAAGRIAGGRVVGLPADVTDAEAIQAATAAVAERFGGLDIVVANAGIAPTPAPVSVMPPDDFERVIHVNLLGVYRTVRAGLDQIVARGGQAVLVSSIYAFMNGVMLSPYAVAKAGVEQLGRALRLELAPHGASATVAYFGFVDTEMVRQRLAEREAQRGADESPLPGFLNRRIPPAQAGEAIARGIERRQARVIAPRWWAAPSVLRGVLNPVIDSAGARSDRVQGEVRRAETTGER